jgi:ArsR family transcriptional regulator, arsenate/arsenite/antimonite-responsive transcriptional repressor
MAIQPIEPLVDLLKTLGHPARLRILALLRGGEMCVCQINAVIGLAASTVSEHLTELRRAGLLAERKDGRWVYYTLRPKTDLQDLVDVLWPHLDEVQQVKKDSKAARAVRKNSPELICASGKRSRVSIQVKV